MGPSGEDDLAGLRLQLVRITDALPDAFAELRAEADATGHRNMSTLAAEFSEDPRRYVALLSAFDDGELVGVGGITREPTDASAIRMRRLYVAQAARRRGVASAIAGALLNEALGAARVVTVHAGNPGAEGFWEALGFTPVAGRSWSHELRSA